MLSGRIKPKRILGWVLVLMLIGCGGTAKTLAMNEPPVTEIERDRIAVLTFQALDEKGNLLEPLVLKNIDLISLSRVMALGVAARLVQFGAFEVLNMDALEKEYGIEPFADDATPYERARLLLNEYPLEQVITGSITLLQTTAVIGIQRFQLADGELKLVGSSMGVAARMSEALALVDTLLDRLFPHDLQVVERSIEQIFLVPAQLRLNLGSSHKITAYALDNLGRPVSNPEFLYFSADEGKVSVNEEGVVTGLQPGTTTVTVRGLTRTTRSGPPATMNVTVIPPAMGIRLGGLVTDKDDVNGWPIRFGLRFTPSFDQAAMKKAQQETIIPTDTSNPLSIISTFFSSLLTSGLMTFDLDFDPNMEILFALNGIQRSSTGYLGTGVGYSIPIGAADQQAFTFRFTVGTQIRSALRLTFPIEAVMDLMFPTIGITKPNFRLGINVGIDLFP